jgi:hypothetical protein
VDQGEQLVTFAGIGPKVVCAFVGHADKSGLACETGPIGENNAFGTGAPGTGAGHARQADRQSRAGALTRVGERGRIFSLNSWVHGEAAISGVIRPRLLSHPIVGLADQVRLARSLLHGTRVAFRRHRKASGESFKISSCQGRRQLGAASVATKLTERHHPLISC